MPATLYFGAPVRQNQSAHKEALDQGLDLLRASPSEVVITCYKDYKQPGHTIFKENLAAFIFLSNNPTTRISSRNPIYHPITTKDVCPTYRKPVVVFSFSRSLNSDQIAEVVRETGSVESRNGNKLSFRHQVSDNALFSKILNLSPGPLKITPTGTTEMNITGFRVYLFLHRLFHAFMKCNQYPGFRTNDITDVGTFENFTVITGDAGVTQDIVVEGGHTLQEHEPDVASGRDRNMIFHCNLSTPVVSYDYMVRSDVQLSNNMTGMSLPYSTALTKSDYGVVPRVIQRYFMGTLAVNQDLARAEFDEIKSSWGNLCKTTWGDELAHMYRGIEIALDSQATLRVVSTDQNVYRGLIMYGGMYKLHAQGKIFEPVPKNELVTELVNSNPHAASLKFIYDSIFYPDTAGRTAAMSAARSLRDVNLQITSQGLVSSRLEEVVKRAQLLSFAGSQGEFLASTAHNISRVFTAIGDMNISELDFPLHPDAIASNSRTERLLSAFGVEIPVFRVPGGKKMSLEGKFHVRERGAGGQSESRDIHTIGAILLPLSRAFPAFKEMKDTKDVLNPFGSRLATQASSSSRIKKWEKDSGDAIISALRLSVGASANVPNAGTKKRSADDDSIDDRGGKRASGFDLDF